MPTTCGRAPGVVIRLRPQPAGTWLAGVHVKRLDPRARDHELRQCYAMLLSGRERDDPNGPPASYRGFRGWWVYGFGANPQQVWLASAESGAPCCFPRHGRRRPDRRSPLLSVPGRACGTCGGPW